MKRVGEWALVVGLCLLGACPVYAQDESRQDADARTHFESGRSYFDRGAYEEALREFRAAYDLSHRAELLYNLYLTAERAADFDAAVDYLEHYLSEGSPDAERRASLEPRLENLRARRDAHGEPVAEPTPEPEPAPAPAPASSGDVVPAVIAFAVAGAGLVTFAVAGGLALAEDGSLETTCGTSCSDAQLSGLNAMTIAADVGWITAAVAGVAGVVLLVTVGMPSETSSATALVVPWATPDGGGLVLGGSF